MTLDDAISAAQEGQEMTRETLLTLASCKTPAVPTCADFDEDCEAIEDKVHCYLYDPAKGMCPYLRAHATPEPQSENKS